jgi:glyoxylase-like metal-dependent hydrolase (beta-lactamase superfamily II)
MAELEIPTWETEMKEIAPGAYAYMRAKGTWWVMNQGLIVGENEAIVVDSTTNKSMTEDFLKEVNKVTARPIRFLINTHFHGDHIYTNYLFPEATVICDIATREETKKLSPSEMEEYSKLSMLWPGVNFDGAKITPQDMTFEKKLTFYQDEREIQVVSVGPAHSPSDSYVYLPKEKVVFCGDLLFYYCTPFALMGYVSGYIQALDHLASLDAKTYVPGHGPICSKEGLYEARDYLVLIRDEGRKYFDDGISYDEAAKRIDLGKYKKWANSERIVGNLARAYSEFRGEGPAVPLDYQAIISKMLEFAGRLK